MKTISESPSPIKYHTERDLGLGKSYQINQMITLSAITLSGFHCTIIQLLLNTL